MYHAYIEEDFKYLEIARLAMRGRTPGSPVVKWEGETKLWSTKDLGTSCYHDLQS